MQRGRNPIVGLAAALLLLGTAPAVAGSNLTGNDLLARCSASASDNPVQWGVCLGYVMAVADLLGQGRAVAGVRACVAADVTSGQLMDVVRQWLERNPARRHINGAALVAVALQQAFPCR
jgi:hypothetical protein